MAQSCFDEVGRILHEWAIDHHAIGAMSRHPAEPDSDKPAHLHAAMQFASPIDCARLRAACCEVDPACYVGRCRSFSAAMRYLLHSGRVDRLPPECLVVRWGDLPSEAFLDLLYGRSSLDDILALLRECQTGADLVYRLRGSGLSLASVLSVVRSLRELESLRFVTSKLPPANDLETF